MTKAEHSSIAFTTSFKHEGGRVFLHVSSEALHALGATHSEQTVGLLLPWMPHLKKIAANRANRTSLDQVVIEAADIRDMVKAAPRDAALRSADLSK